MNTNSCELRMVGATSFLEQASELGDVSSLWRVIEDKKAFLRADGDAGPASFVRSPESLIPPEESERLDDVIEARDFCQFQSLTMGPDFVHTKLPAAPMNAECWQSETFLKSFSLFEVGTALDEEVNRWCSWAMSAGGCAETCLRSPDDTLCVFNAEILSVSGATSDFICGFQCRSVSPRSKMFKNLMDWPYVTTRSRVPRV